MLNLAALSAFPSLHVTIEIAACTTIEGSDFQYLSQQGLMLTCADHVQDRIRQYHKELIRQAGGLVTTPRLLEHLLGGLGSKNTRTRVDCVELIGEVLAEEGLTPFAKLKQKPFAIIGQVCSPCNRFLTSPLLSLGPEYGRNVCTRVHAACLVDVHPMHCQFADDKPPTSLCHSSRKIGAR